MKKQAVALVICSLMVVSICVAQVPSAVFIGDGPGIDVPFLDDGVPVTYGQVTHVGGFNWDGTGGATDNWGFFRYRPSLAGDPGTHVDMPSDQDWVFEISFMQEGGIGTEGPFYLKDNDLDKRMLGVTNHQDGTYSLTAANADNSMRVVAGPLALAEGEWGDFVYHYKSATGLVDAYFNGALVAGDFEIETMAGDGAMADFAQGEWQRAGTTWFRSVKLGQYGDGTGPVCDPGDADQDGDVDDDDLSLLLANWGQTVDCSRGEFSGTPPVNDDDLSLLLANWTGPLAAAVPEPATMGLMAAASGIWLSRRRRRR